MKKKPDKDTEKKVLEDIKTDRAPHERSIQNVHVERAERNNHNNTPPPPPGRGPRSFSPKKSKWIMWAGGFIVLLILGFTFASIFSGTKILAQPRNEHVVVDATFQAVKSAGEAADLQYEIMTITRDVHRDVEATGEVFVEEKASGTITVYNDYNRSPQKLIRNTRFETPEGLVYRIREPIVVPGQKEAGGETIPGSITVTVYADEASEKFNIGKTEFTIPGLEGSPQYDHFYARSETPMTGGFKGMKKTVSEEDRDKAVEEMHEELRTTVLTEAKNQKPDGFLLYDSAVFLRFRPLSDQTTEDGKARIREEVTFKGIIFDKRELSSHIASSMLASYEDEPVEVLGLEEIDFSLKDREKIDINEHPKIIFTLAGQGDIVWLYDEASLRASLLGQSRSSIDSILNKYPSIEQAEVVVRPFWKRTLPDDPKKIRIERVLEI